MKIECPQCGASEGLRGPPEGDGIRITCGSCAECGEQPASRRSAMSRYARTTVDETRDSDVGMMQIGELADRVARSLGTLRAEPESGEELARTLRRESRHRTKPTETH